VVLVLNEVLIFQCGAALDSAFDFSAIKAAFQVVNASDFIFVIEAECVAHEDEVHFLVVLHLDGVHAINT